MLPLILSVLIAFSSFYSGECAVNSLVPALYVFGDSLVDAGNNNLWFVNPLAKANYHPYGIDYKHGVATGRVTNGKNVPDFVADFLNLPPPPPYRNESSRPSPKGYNYASAGCGIRPDTGLIPLPLGCASMFNQLNLFETTVNTELPLYIPDPEKRAQHLADSIFLIWVGNNDYLLNYFNPFLPPTTPPQQWAEELVDRFSGQIKRLYGLGARKMVVFEVAPFGCIPAYVQGGDECVADKSANATLFNRELHSMIQTLASDPELEGATFSVAKINELAHHAFMHPAKYGLEVVNAPCCELGQAVECKKDGTVCAHRKKYLFFDGAHPTQAAYEILGKRCIHDPSICSPTIAQLAGHRTNSVNLHSVA